jgi:DNA-binding response OmpR family regulator
LSFDRAIDVRVSRLRAKLQDPPRAPKIIKTIYGAGFILIAELDGSPELG